MSCACCSGGLHSSDSFDPFINLNTLARKCPLDNQKHTFKSPPLHPSSPKCKLQALPTEVYQQCLQYLDIRSLTDMRRVSQFTRGTIDGMHQYKELYEHAPQALRAVLSTWVAASTDLLRLHESLTDMECYYCKEADPTRPSFGTYLSLFDCRRSCMFCLINSPALYPVEFTTLMMICMKGGTSPKQLSSLNLIRTLPGTYGSSGFGIYKRNQLIRGPSIATLKGKPLSYIDQRVLYGRIQSEECIEIHHHPLVKPGMESDTRPWSNYVEPNSLQRSAQCYQTAILFPYLPSSKQNSDYGVKCPDCMLHMQWEEKRWSRQQERRRNQGTDPAAPNKVRNFMNMVRRQGAACYTISEDSIVDGAAVIERCRLLGEGLEFVIESKTNTGRDSEAESKEEKDERDSIQVMSIQEHRLVHEREELPKDEAAYRAKTKKTNAALSLLRP